MNLTAKTTTGRFYAPKGYVAGTTYSLGDLPTTEETGGADFVARYRGTFRAVPTGEKRAPKTGEWYLSGAIVAAYRAGGGLTSEYMIAKLVKVERVPAVETYRIVG